MKYRAYDKLTKARHLVRTIDFQFQKVQLVPPNEKCHLKYIRIFDQLVFEKSLELFDSNVEEIYEGDILYSINFEEEFFISEKLELYNFKSGVVGFLSKENSKDFTVIKQMDYSK